MIHLSEKEFEEIEKRVGKDKFRVIENNEAPAEKQVSDAASEIIALHNEIIEHLTRVTLEKAIRIGELLLAQKKKLGHGNYIKWIAEKLPFSSRTAQRYMMVYRNRGKFKNDSVSYLGEAYRILSAKNMTLAEELQHEEDVRARHYKKEREEFAKEREKENRLEAEKQAEIRALAEYYVNGFPGTDIRIDEDSLDLFAIRWNVEHPPCQSISEYEVRVAINELMPDIFFKERYGSKAG